MPCPHGAHYNAGDHGRGHEGVRNAAMALQLLHRPGKGPEHIQIGGLGSQHSGKRGAGRFAVQPRAADAGSGQEMGDWLHGSPQSILSR